MYTVFVNGLSAKAGGGKSIFLNYLELLSLSVGKVRYVVLAPVKNNFCEFKNANIEIIYLPKMLTYKVFFPFVYDFVLPVIVRKWKVDVVFNLADLPIKIKTKQVFLFDWPYAVYPKSEVWKMMDFSDFLLKKYKLYFFSKNLKYIDVIIAQSLTMSQKLTALYHLSNIKVVPNAVSLNNLTGGTYRNYTLPCGLKFLYLTHYYPHKNIEIFIKVAKRIKAEGLDFKLVITLDSNQHPRAKSFLKNIRTLQLEEIIVNVGAVKMEFVPSLYAQCDALLMPTLLESFSGTYVEAMFHNKPILTSKYDFAKDVCKNGAFYFDPHNPDDILSTMKRLSDSKDLQDYLVLNGRNVLRKMPNWNDAFLMYNGIIKGEIENY